MSQEQNVLGGAKAAPALSKQLGAGLEAALSPAAKWLGAACQAQPFPPPAQTLSALGISPRAHRGGAFLLPFFIPCCTPWAPESTWGCQPGFPSLAPAF